MKSRIRRYARKVRLRRFWKRVVSVFSSIVMFATIYALLLPAITLEKNAACGIEEHEHNQACFEQRLICGREETAGHLHTDDCYAVTRTLVCTIQEHSHTEECFDQDGNLICELAEHTHESGCMREDRILSCGLEEVEPHFHTDACYESVLVCEKPVHIHSADCYAVDEPVYEEPVQEPVYEEPVQEPVYQEPVYEEPVQEPVYEEPIYVDPAQEPVNEEPVYEEPV